MSQSAGHARPGSPPPTLPDFDLVRRVGQGGFGEVWLATNRTTGHLRAVKIVALRPAGNVSPAAREITSLTRLEAGRVRPHDNLLTIHHIGQTAEHLYYVMDPADDVRGGPASLSPDYQPATLQARLQAGPLPAADCVRYAGQLLAGLAELHAAGMVHRDVKPANCLFVDGQLKLADFGLVTADHPLVSRLGSPKYMPPDGRMDMRADVYAAGLVIYEMLSGLPVSDFPSLGRRAQEIGGDPQLTALLQLALQACEPEAERRPADAGAMLAELTRTGPTGRRPRRWGPAAALAAALVLLGAWAARSLMPTAEKRCDVNFVTEPYEARIYLDDVLQCDPAGKPYTTPCTLPDLPARSCRVSFEYAGQARWEAGQFDLARMRQVVARRPEPQPSGP